MTKNTNKAKLELIPTGFIANRIGTVNWEDVAEIRGYKTDNFTTDEIWIEYRLRDGRTIPVSEEWPGFAAVADQMSRQFPSTAAWHAALSQPPFRRSETVLFRAKESPAPRPGASSGEA